METVHAKEESKRLRQQLTDLRSKLGDLEARVSAVTLTSMINNRIDLNRFEKEIRCPACLTLNVFVFTTIVICFMRRTRCSRRRWS
jgi:hypothetical protein